MNRRRPRTPAALARSAEKARKDRVGYLIIGVSVLVVLLLITVGIFIIDTDRIDRRTGCLLNNRPPEAHTVVLVDETDALSRDDLVYARAVIFNEYFWLPIGGRLTVRNILSDMDSAEDIVVCRVDDGSNSLGIYDNPKHIRQTFDRIAGQRLEALYTSLHNAAEQEYSPILEYIVATPERANFGTNVTDRRLILISDMAQHSSLFSHYRRSPLPRADSDSTEHGQATLSGVKVRIHYISRRELRGVQGESHRRFWIDRLRDLGAGDVALGRGLLIGEEPTRETWTDDS